jgi:prepilin-type N-terminal cleavage/methylation domain-containing protein
MAQLFSRVALRGDIGGNSMGSSYSTKPRRKGFTLVEVLVAMAITLLIMATIVTVFSQIGTSVADSRASIEMSEQVQGVRDRLQRDLGNITVSAKPWLRLESGSGYLEIIEGPRSDLVVTDAPETGVITSTNATLLTLPTGTRVPATALGDFDDILMFTSNDPDAPFLGRGFRYVPASSSGGSTGVEFAMIESNDAEIIWYAIEHPVANDGDANFIGEPGFRTIYRRALIVSPGTPIPNSATINGTTIQPHSLNIRQFYQYFDISVHRDPTGSFWVPNSLSDLTWRQNRFAHDPSTFPYQVDVTRIRPYNGTSSLASPLGPLLLERQGEDIMLRNALAFDVRAYDPQAPLRLSSGVAVSPGAPGWASGSATSDNAVGAFVDLNYLSYGGTLTSNSWFSNVSQNVSGSGARLFNAHWDTWPFAYEQDANDQDGDGTIDEGVNGFDDNGNGVIDDPGEYETQPPYISPMRGVMVRLRAYEPYSRQVRDVSVVENFSGK